MVGEIPNGGLLWRAPTAASASAHPNSIKGLAQSIAKPAYRRLLNAEPLLRRAVPVLIIAFLGTICVGALVQVLDHRRQTLSNDIMSLEAVADLATERLQQLKKSPPDRPSAARAHAGAPNLGNGRRPALPSDQCGRRGYSRGAHRRRNAGPPAGRPPGRDPTPDNVWCRRRRDGNLPARRYAHAWQRCERLALRSASSPWFSRADAALASWRSLTTLTVTLSATTGFVVLILGFAFHWQATRAREADVIYETVRSRIDTALNRGRCGLWDWDLARGRIFWSQSMFEILGLETKDDLLSFGDVNALVHPGRRAAL